MYRCAAVGCNNQLDDSTQFAEHPGDPKRRKIWEARIKDGSLVGHGYRICMDHFEDEMFEREPVNGKRKLRANAIPTLFKRRRQAPKSVRPKPPAAAPDRPHPVSVLRNQPSTAAEAKPPTTAAAESVCTSQRCVLLFKNLEHAVLTLREQNAGIKRTLQSTLEESMRLRSQNERMAAELARFKGAAGSVTLR